MGLFSLFSRTDDHQWSQQHLSHYVDGDLGPRARHRLDRHAEDCVDCSRGVRAMRALVRLIPAFAAGEPIRAPNSIFDRVRTGTIDGTGDGAPPRPPKDA